jgi:hypothetical protein
MAGAVARCQWRAHQPRSARNVPNHGRRPVSWIGVVQALRPASSHSWRGGAGIDACADCIIESTVLRGQHAPANEDCKRTIQVSSRTHAASAFERPCRLYRQWIADHRQNRFRILWLRAHDDLGCEPVTGFSGRWFATGRHRCPLAVLTSGRALYPRAGVCGPTR